MDTVCWKCGSYDDADSDVGDDYDDRYQYYYYHYYGNDYGNPDNTNKYSTGFFSSREGSELFTQTSRNNPQSWKDQFSIKDLAKKEPVSNGVNSS